MEEHVWADARPAAHCRTTIDGCRWSRHTGAYSRGNSQPVDQIKATVRSVYTRDGGLPSSPWMPSGTPQMKPLTCFAYKPCGTGCMMTEILTVWIFLLHRMWWIPWLRAPVTWVPPCNFTATKLNNSSGRLTRFATHTHSHAHTLELGLGTRKEFYYFGKKSYNTIGILKNVEELEKELTLYSQECNLA